MPVTAFKTVIVVEVTLEPEVGRKFNGNGRKCWGGALISRLGVFKENSRRGGAELLASVETGNLENEDVASNLALELVDEVGSSLGRTTGSNDVVDNQDLLAFTDGIHLHLEKVLAILLDVLGRSARARELALLPNGRKGNAQAESEAGAEQETTGVKADDDIGLDRKGLGDLQLEGVDESSVGDRVGKEGHNIDKVDARNWEIGEAAQRLAQAYLCTGELGGGGGHGGGLSSRGILTGSVVRGGRG